MYLEFFGFKETPFSIAPDPRYLYMSERHREALAHLVYGVKSEGGFVLLTGEVGTGKTTVCRCLFEQVPEEAEIAFILNPKVTTVELLATLCDELGISYPEGCSSNKLFIDRINARLLENYARGRRTVLILDEAQNLDPDVLEQIRLLTNLETNERKLLHIIMLGQPELRAKVAQPELRQLAQRITARYHLEPLSFKETEAYIRHRLRVGGVARRIFSRRSLSLIHRLSGGVPRRINVLCDRSLLGAYVQGKERVDARTVVRAAREAFDGPRRPFLLRWQSAALVAVAAALAGLLFALHIREAPVSPPAAPVAVDPPPVAPPPVVQAAFRWPEGEGSVDSRQLAFDALFRLWGLSPGGGDPCREAEARGLLCFDRQDGLESLRRFNLPAVLPLTRKDGRTYFATLIALDGANASFQVGPTRTTVPVEALQTAWNGRYTLLWRKPPFEGALLPGARGASVRWLADRLAFALNLPPFTGEPVLQGDLLAQLKRFQFSRGVAPDGMAGPFTLILLDAASGKGVPLLRSASEAK